MAQRQAQGALPRLSDAADARVLNQFWDDVILGQPPYTANDVPSLQDIAGKGNEFFRIYAAALFDRPAAGAQLDEYIRFQAFLARTEAATVPALTDHWTRLSDEQKDQVRHQGLFIKREGLHRTAASLIKTMLATHVGPANRDYLAGVLAQHALALAAGMTSADRAEIAAMIRQAVRSLPPTRQQALKEVADAMAAMPCEGLCAVR